MTRTTSVPIRRRRWRAAVAAAAGAVLIGSLAAVPAQAVTSNNTCASVVEIGVRGTDEGAGNTLGPAAGKTWLYGGFGLTNAVTSKVQTSSPVTVRRNGLNYPAKAVAPIYPLSLGKGVDALRAELAYYATRCPSTRLVLVGYSQGAHVIGDVLAKSANPQVSSTVKAKIKAIVFFGDPAYRAGEPFNYGGGLESGVFARGKGELAAFSSRLLSYCYPNDDWCQDASGTNAAAIHRSYGNVTPTNTASRFILDRL